MAVVLQTYLAIFERVGVGGGRGVQQCEVRGVQRGRHVGDLEPDALVGGEVSAGVGVDAAHHVAGGEGVRCSRDAERGRGQAEDQGRECVGEQGHPAAVSTDAVLRFHFAVQDDGVGAVGPHAECVPGFLDRQAVGVGGQQEHGLAAAELALAGGGVDQVVVDMAGAGAEGLGALQGESVVAGGGAQRWVEDIAAGAGFGEAPGDQFAVVDDLPEDGGGGGVGAGGQQPGRAAVHGEDERG
jgi:hypothetical protein